MNEVVKYHNQMNKLKFKGFNAVELDLLMTICSKMKEQGLKTIQFSFEQLRKLSKYSKDTEIKRFVKDLNNTYRKLIKIDFWIETEHKIIGFVLFSKYEIDKLKETVTIGVNPEFYYVLNELTSNFSVFELEEFLNIKSKFSKECYRRLKQYRHTGLWKIDIEEFRAIMDIPKSYQMCNIDKTILSPIKKELSSLFEGFKIQKKKGIKNKVTHLIFTFKPEERNKSIPNKYPKIEKKAEESIYNKPIPKFRKLTSKKILISEKQKDKILIENQRTIDELFER